MDVFDLRNRLVSDYRSYTRSFIKIRDARIEAFVDGILGAGGFWPEPLLQLNPTFRPGGTVDELVELGILHRECAQIFRIDKSDTDHRGKQLLLHQHQREAIRSNPPDILLTNYMMLELLLTRSEDRELVRAAQGLRFLVFDELHTYRGRQGADIAMLIRRCRHAFGNDIICVGTSATMTSGGGSEDQRLEVARVSQSLFGVDFAPEQIASETLERATPEINPADASVQRAIRAAIASDDEPPSDYEAFRSHPLASWIESTFGVREEAGTGELLRQVPRRLEGGPIERLASELIEERSRQAEHRAPGAPARRLDGEPTERSEREPFEARQRQAEHQSPGAPPRRQNGEAIGDRQRAAAELSALADADSERCAKVLREWLLQGSKLYPRESTAASPSSHSDCTSS